MKQSSDYSQVKFRPGNGSKLEQALTARAETEESTGLVAKRDLERYYALIGLSLPVFSEQEALLLVNTLNASRINAETIHRLYVDVDEYLEEHPLEGFNRGAFVARLRNCSRLECMAIADAVERFWQGDYHKNEQESSQRLRDVFFHGREK